MDDTKLTNAGNSDDETEETGTDTVGLEGASSSSTDCQRVK